MVSASPQAARTDAETQFAAGLKCAESVAGAIARARGLDDVVATRAATAFCSGMARTCGPCGALTGAVLGVSLVLGRTQASEPVEPSYDVVRKVVDAFEAEFGARDCVGLLGVDMTTPEGAAAFRAQKMLDRCRAFTGRAAELATEMLAQADDAKR